MKYAAIVFGLILTFTNQSVICQENTQTVQEQEVKAIEEPNEELLKTKNLLDSLDPKRGEIKLLDGVATLQVPDGFYYLNPSDSEKVLVEIWGNPSSNAQGILGMLFPSEGTPLDEGSWGVIIEYEEEGYVSDEDADEIDYQELLLEMQEDTEEANKERVELGYDPVHLVGWASPPYYDKVEHKMHWAKEFSFEPHWAKDLESGQENAVNTLNYNIRVLGRKGVLVLTFVARMDEKELIDSKIDEVLKIAEFNQEYRYEDFDPGIDKVAVYGLGALVAGKVLAKAGVFAVALTFLKKFGMIILVAIGVIIKKVFGRKKEE